MKLAPKATQAVLTLFALTALSAGPSQAGKPVAPAPSPAPTGITQAKVGGDAYGVNASVSVDIGNVLNVGSLLLDQVGTIASVKLGPFPHVSLPKYGGFDSETVATVNVLDLVGSRTLLSLTEGGIGTKKAGASSASAIENLNLLGLIKADLLVSYCASHANGAVAGSAAQSSLVGLTIGGQAINVATPPNTKVTLLAPSGLLGSLLAIATVTINEQIQTGDGLKSSGIVNNALHVAFDRNNALSLLLGKVVGGDIVVSSASCSAEATIGSGGGGNPPPDTDAFVTGGGRVDSSTGFATFGFNARANRGQLQYVDHGTKMKIHGDSVTSFTVQNAQCVQFSGSASLNGEAGHAYTAQVCDFAEPGKGVDTFSITLDNGAYSNARTLTGGNIQLHN